MNHNEKVSFIKTHQIPLNLFEALDKVNHVIDLAIGEGPKNIDTQKLWSTLIALTTYSEIILKKTLEEQAKDENISKDLVTSELMKIADLTRECVIAQCIFSNPNDEEDLFFYFGTFPEQQAKIKQLVKTFKTNPEMDLTKAAQIISEWEQNNKKQK